jgi:hypothetical protein
LADRVPQQQQQVIKPPAKDGHPTKEMNVAKVHLTLEDIRPTAEEQKENQYIAHARAELLRLANKKRQHNPRRVVFFLLLAVDIALLAYDAILI